MAASKDFPLSLTIKAIDKVTAPLRNIGSQMKGFAKITSSLGKKMSLGVTAPLAGIGAASFAAFSKFEAGMASVSTLIDTNVESLDEMSKQVLAISRRTPVAIGDLTDALAAARGAGVSAADQFKVLEGSARLGSAALGTTKDAVDLVTSSINAFGLKGAEADRVYNLLFQATNTGKMTLAQLGQGFGGVAGTVANAGVQLDEYLASVAALTTTGLPASEAHTQLRAVIAGLTRDSELASEVFKRLGAKDFKDLIKQSGGLIPSLNRVREVLKGSDKYTLKLLGSTEALNAVQNLTGNTAGAFAEALGTMRSGVDGVGEAYEKQASTLASKMKISQNTINGIAISIGRVLGPVLEHLAPMLQKAATWWAGLGGETQKTIVIFGGVAAAIGPALTALSGFATVFGAVNTAITFAGSWGKYLWMMRASIMAGLIPSITAATASVWGFTVALLANPITWVVLAVAALAGAAYLIYKNWEPIKAFFIRTWESIKTTVGPAVEWIWGLLKKWTILGPITENWEPIKAFFGTLWDGIVKTFQWAWEKIQPIVEAVKTAFDYTPLGLAIKGGKMLFGAEEARPTLGAAAAPVPGGVRPTEARVSVDFANLPKGARVTQDNKSTAPLDLSMGYSMLGAS